MKSFNHKFLNLISLYFFIGSVSCVSVAAEDEPAIGERATREVKIITQGELSYGRPADFYWLNYFGEGKESVCNDILTSMNVEYSRERIRASEKNPWRDILLNNALNVTWDEIPYFETYTFISTVDGLEKTSRLDGSFPLSMYTADLNKDGTSEQLFRIFGQSPTQQNRLFIIRERILPEEIVNISSEQMSDIGIYNLLGVRGSYMRAMIEKVQSEFQDYNVRNTNGYIPFRSAFIELAELDGEYYFLIMNNRLTLSNRPTYPIDVFAIKFMEDDSLNITCRLTSYDQI